MNKLRGFVSSRHPSSSNQSVGLGASLGIQADSANNSSGHGKQQGDKEGFHRVAHVGAVTESKKTKYTAITCNNNSVVVGLADGTLQCFETDNEHVIFKQTFSECVGRSIDQLLIVDGVLFALVEGNVRVYQYPNMRTLDEVDLGGGAYQFSLSSLHNHVSQFEAIDSSSLPSSPLKQASPAYLAVAIRKRNVHIYRWDTAGYRLAFKCELPFSQTVASMLWFPAQSDWATQLASAERAMPITAPTSMPTAISRLPAPTLGGPLAASVEDGFSGGFSFGASLSFTPTPLSSPFSLSSTTASPALTPMQPHTHTPGSASASAPGSSSSPSPDSSFTLVSSLLPPTPLLLLSAAAKPALLIADPAHTQVTTVALPVSKRTANAPLVLAAMPYATALAVRGTQALLVDWRGRCVVLTHVPPTTASSSSSRAPVLMSLSPHMRARSMSPSPSLSPLASSFRTSPAASSPMLAALSSPQHTRPHALDTGVRLTTACTHLFLDVLEEPDAFLELSEPPLAVSYQHPYVYATTAHAVDVYNPYTAGEQLVQSLPVKGAALMAAAAAIYVATPTAVSVLAPVSVGTQLRALAKRQQHDVALSLCGLSLPRQWPHGLREWTYRLHQCSLMYAYHAFAQGHFDAALSAFQLCGCDPRLVLALFPQVLPTDTDLAVTPPMRIPPFASHQEVLRALSALIPYLSYVRDVAVKHLGPSVFATTHTDGDAGLSAQDVMPSLALGTPVDGPLSPLGGAGFELIDDYDPSAEDARPASLPEPGLLRAEEETTRASGVMRKPSHLSNLSSSLASTLMRTHHKQRQVPAQEAFTVPPLTSFLTAELLRYVDTAIVMTYIQTNPAPILSFLDQPCLCHTSFIAQQLLSHELYAELVQLYKSRGQHTNALFVLRNNASAASARPSARSSPADVAVYLGWLLHCAEDLVLPSTVPATAREVLSMLHGVAPATLALVLEHLPWLGEHHPDDVMTVFQLLSPLMRSAEAAQRANSSLMRSLQAPTTRAGLRYPPSTALRLLRALQGCAAPSSVCLGFLEQATHAYEDLLGLVAYVGGEPVVNMEYARSLLPPTTQSDGGLSLTLRGGLDTPRSTSGSSGALAELLSEPRLQQEVAALQTLHTSLALVYLSELLAALQQLHVYSQDQLDALAAQHAAVPEQTSGQLSRLWALQQQLQTFLSSSRLYRAEAVLAKCPQDVLLVERTAVLHRMGRHRDILVLCVSRGDHAAAEAYCVRTHAERGDATAFATLVSLYLARCSQQQAEPTPAPAPSHTRGIVVAGAPTPTPVPSGLTRMQRARVVTSAQAPVRTITNAAGLTAPSTVAPALARSASTAAAAALEAETEAEAEQPEAALSEDMTAALSLLAKHPYALDVTTAIGLIPAQVRLAQVEPFLRAIVAGATQKAMHVQLEKNLTRYEALRLRMDLLQAYRAHVAVDRDTVCVYCGKKVGIAAFAAGVDKRLYHYVCYVNNENEFSKK